MLLCATAVCLLNCRTGKCDVEILPMKRLSVWDLLDINKDVYLDVLDCHTLSKFRLLPGGVEPKLRFFGEFNL